MKDKLKTAQDIANGALEKILTDVRAAAKLQGVQLSEVTLLLLVDDELMVSVSSGKVDPDMLPDYVTTFGRQLAKAKQAAPKVQVH